MWAALKIAVATIACTAMIAGPAHAAGRTGKTFTVACGTGTISFPDGSVLFPPNHKYHAFPVTYSGGAPGDVLDISARSSDGAGVQNPGSSEATVQAGATTATAAVGLLGDRSGRMFVVSYAVGGSNACGGLVLVVPTRPGHSA